MTESQADPLAARRAARAKQAEILDRAAKRGRAAREREGHREPVRSDAPVPSRITAALNLAMLYGPEVDRALGGEEPMVDQWEAGELVPTREQIVTLAMMTGLKPDWFYRPQAQESGTVIICGQGGCVAHEFGPPVPVAPVVPLAKDTLW